MYGIILAGGSGSRLWPLSRELYPKQLLKLISSKSLLERTYERLMGIMGINNIFAITSTKHINDVRVQLSAYNKDIRVLGEPVFKNTAPAIAIAVKYILDYKGDDIVIVSPSDNLIKDDKEFRQTIEQAKKLAQKDYIVTLGVKPNKPLIGFGYIKTKEKTEDGYIVESFKEKPDLKTAQEFIENPNYFWNSGILVFRAQVFMDTLKKYANEIYEIVQKFDFKKQDDIPYMTFDTFPSISIDYAILEKTDNLAMVEMLSHWDDFGSWNAVYNLSKKDENGNVKIGDIIEKDCNDSLFFSSNRLIAGIGLKDLFVVETSDAILVCNKNNAQDVKQIFDKLKEEKNDAHKIHTTVYRPWGYYTVLNQGEGYLTKMICVSKKGQLSLQSHNHRSEHWMILSGTARVTLDNKVFMLKAGSSIDIPTKAVHSVANPYDTELKIIEVQKGDKLTEDDIVRYKDIYGRVKAKN